MALFDSMTLEHMPYTLRRQREATFTGVRTKFWIRPMKHREFQRFNTARELAALAGRASADEIAARISDTDEQTLMSVMNRMENAFKDGDDLTDPAELAKAIDHLPWQDLQEVLFATRDRSQLEEGAKNS